MPISIQINKIICSCKDNMEEPEKIKMNRNTLDKLIDEQKYVCRGNLEEPGIIATIHNFMGVPIVIDDELIDNIIVLIHKLR